MDMRHLEPSIVTIYRATIKAEPPMVCHTCDNYQQNGICAEFNAEPPEAFASEPGECSFWVWEIPF
jgi:hypothetical protein